MTKNPLAFKAASVSAFACMLVFSSILYISCNKKDACADVVCNNNGYCNEGKCECLLGFSGSSCDLYDATKFAGTYTGINPCTNGTTFKIDTSIANKVLINMNIGTGNCAKNVNVSGSVIGDTIKFPAQGFIDECDSSYAFSANGYRRNDSLFITLRYNFPLYKDTCVFMGKK